VFGLLGKKIGMSQLFLEEGTLVPVSVIQAGPCSVTQLKTKERDGYEAVQLGFEDKKRNVTKPLRGHFKRSSVAPKRYLGEFPPAAGMELTEGAEVKVDVFKQGELVDVSGITKGRGFAGVVRRYRMGGGPASHGHTSHRRVGSIGQCASPSRVWKGQRMPGQMGGVLRTVQNLKVVKIDTEKGLLFVHGAVPGPNGGLVEVRKAVKTPRKAVEGKS
jgi:large subunit ribosomal protein L3